MLAADEFELEELTDKLGTLIIETKDCYRNGFKKLKNFCNDIVVKYPKLIFDSSDSTSLGDSSIASLLKRDDLQIEEIKIWD
ncbi:hypothetical protein Glove_29g154 [Diversispora epigaea]|uniref:Uncharacterized protein n=1 Tax=Diversispora epigaea TaxID=1348612 RepID=A0A397JPI0_9GLOM|nr:hypothetical protein Glove_29g154 [Diversispora epigaea]